MTVPEPSGQPYELLDPDVQLMLRVKDDDAAAFEELVLRYQGRLLTLLEHAVGSRDQADDLAQEVFLRVFRARKSYSPDAKFVTWLYRIANNVASNSRRAARRRRETAFAAPRPDETGPAQIEEFLAAASGLMPTRRVDKAERAEVVRLALDFLNERQRMAILLSKFEDMSYEDIANTMGMSVKATKSLLSRARENLRLLLEPYLQEGTRPSPETQP